MSDAAARSLFDALANSTNIKALNLGSIVDVLTSTSWRVLFRALRSPTCVLRYLDMTNNQLSDRAMTSLTDALASNRSLKCLNLNDWAPPLSVLYNTTSIMIIYNSNHTLEELGREDELPEELESLLQINKENTPSQAARIKIIKTHFKMGFSTHPFVDMDLNMLPRAMTWMIRDSAVSEVNGRFYSFILIRECACTGQKE